MADIEYRWTNSHNLASKPYICGHCSHSISSERGYVAHLYDDNGRNLEIEAEIYVCHFCGKPTFFDFTGEQSPGPKHGHDVSGIDDQGVKDLYEEARRAIGANAPTAAVLACRKLLMHIAVEKSAPQNLSFLQYVEYLSAQGYIPPDSKEWVDEIREKGNEANHEIILMTEQEAKDLLELTEMLLKIIYQFPAEIKKKRAAKAVT